jgi:CRISPR-associated protein Cas1
MHREYDADTWESGDLPNRCLSAATACLYGITEAAVLAAGYAPAIGFIHTGKPLSFVYDIGDLVKFGVGGPPQNWGSRRARTGSQRTVTPGSTSEAVSPTSSMILGRP